MAYTNSFALGATNWIGVGVCGAALVAFNLGVVAYGFALFLVSFLPWDAVSRSRT
jgi:hypothetical protein